MGRAGKDRQDDGRVGFTVQGRAAHDGMGWGDGDVVEEKQGVQHRVLADG